MAPATNLGLAVERWSLTASDIMNQFKEVKHVNTSLLKKDIPCIIISVEKTRKGHVRELHHMLCQDIDAMEGVKMVLYVEHTVDANDLATALWRFCNNLDPKRDHILFQDDSKNDADKTFACLGLDGTRKTKAFDNFHRDWPNIIVADDATIKAMDKKWDALEIGEFLSSPSLKFKDQMYGEEAVVN